VRVNQLVEFFDCEESARQLDRTALENCIACCHKRASNDAAQRQTACETLDQDSRKR
jgi:hypothetical protein